MTHLTMLALGSRGDVLPYVVLGAGLQQHGFTVRVVTFERRWPPGITWNSRPYPATPNNS
ncbi:MAG: hypothetical protein HND44_13585 [Chloroflexi bacterium]|nr:hypothetical protein [Ardenticatenaceae bacterium]MBL1129506.1 hypothetical protein [Chloroflexota bacterium]NOG35588.1 hypothetical protein [Chloroflexota bacterium]GIK58723.1 MAG: hypothetical protein BroJett015_43860 [Chloroflexota bacterium]